MPAPELNPTRAIDGDKADYFARHNVPLFASKIIEGHFQHAIEERQNAQADTDMAAKLGRALSEAEERLRADERALAEAKSVSPHDQDFVKASRARRDAAKERCDKHQRKMEKKRMARANGAMTGDDLKKLIVRHLHRPMKPIEFEPVADSDATTEALSKIVKAMADERNAIAEAQAAFLPSHEAFDDFKRDVDRRLSRYHTNPLVEYFHVRYQDDDPRKPQPPQVTLNIEHLAMRAVRELILSFGENVFRDLGERLAFEGEPLGRAERKKVIAGHLAAIDALELEEGRIRRALAMKGIFIPLRADTVNILSVLGVEFDAKEAERRERAASAA